MNGNNRYLASPRTYSIWKTTRIISFLRTSYEENRGEKWRKALENVNANILSRWMLFCFLSSNSCYMKYFVYFCSLQWDVFLLAGDTILFYSVGWTVMFSFIVLLDFVSLHGSWHFCCCPPFYRTLCMSSHWLYSAFGGKSALSIKSSVSISYDFAEQQQQQKPKSKRNIIFVFLLTVIVSGLILKYVFRWKIQRALHLVKHHTTYRQPRCVLSLIFADSHRDNHPSRTNKIAQPKIHQLLAANTKWKNIANFNCVEADGNASLKIPRRSR